MTTCCDNIITPKMIRTGQMQIGDKIQLEEFFADSARANAAAPVSAPVQSEVANQESAAEVQAAPVSAAPAEEAAAPASATPPEDAAAPVNATGYIENQAASPSPAQMQAQAAQNAQNMQGQMYAPAGINPATRIPAENAAQNLMAGAARATTPAPLSYQDMTSYMNGVHRADVNGQPMVAVPQTPLSSTEYTPALDNDNLQQYLGFLHTQIGRYMRIDQLIGSNIVEERYGFLVGVGSNFIILQEITTGNIMVIDLFSIRLTYIYYSDVFVPQL